MAIRETDSTFYVIREVREDGTPGKPVPGRDSRPFTDPAEVRQRLADLRDEWAGDRPERWQAVMITTITTAEDLDW